MTTQKSIETYVSEHTENLNFKTLEDWEIIQIKCEIADTILHDRHPDLEHWHKSNERDYDHYNSESQVLFHEYYDIVKLHIDALCPPLQRPLPEQDKSIETYVSEYTKDRTWTKSKYGEQDIHNDIACEVADIILHDKHPNTQHWIEDTEDLTRFTDDSQVLFDQYYDEVWSHLEELQFIQNETLKMTERKGLEFHVNANPQKYPVPEATVNAVFEERYPTHKTDLSVEEAKSIKAAILFEIKEYLTENNLI